MHRDTDSDPDTVRATSKSRASRDEVSLFQRQPQGCLSFALLPLEDTVHFQSGRGESWAFPALQKGSHSSSL